MEAVEKENMAPLRSSQVGAKPLSAVVAVVAPCVLAGCGNGSGSNQQSFTLGWLLLSLLVLFMLVLFVGLIRYLKAGRKKDEPEQRPLDYEYKADKDEDDEL